jgi:hypothetical protein
VESLARGGPWRMGTVVRNKSTWRALSEEETERYGGSSLRRLYGCVFTLQFAQARQPAPGGNWKSRSLDCNEPVQEHEQQLLTWAQVLLINTSVFTYENSWSLPNIA